MGQYIQRQKGTGLNEGDVIALNNLKSLGDDFEKRRAVQAAIVNAWKEKVSAKRDKYKGVDVAIDKYGQAHFNQKGHDAQRLDYRNLSQKGIDESSTVVIPDSLAKNISSAKSMIQTPSEARKELQKAAKESVNKNPRAAQSYAQDTENAKKNKDLATKKATEIAGKKDAEMPPLPDINGSTPGPASPEEALRDDVLFKQQKRNALFKSMIEKPTNNTFRDESNLTRFDKRLDLRNNADGSVDVPEYDPIINNPRFIDPIHQNKPLLGKQYQKELENRTNPLSKKDVQNIKLNAPKTVPGSATNQTDNSSAGAQVTNKDQASTSEKLGNNWSSTEKQEGLTEASIAPDTYTESQKRANLIDENPYTYDSLMDLAGQRNISNTALKAFGIDENSNEWADRAKNREFFLMNFMGKHGVTEESSAYKSGLGQLKFSPGETTYREGVDNSYTTNIIDQSNKSVNVRHGGGAKTVDPRRINVPTYKGGNMDLTETGQKGWFSPSTDKNELEVSGSLKNLVTKKYISDNPDKYRLRNDKNKPVSNHEYYDVNDPGLGIENAIYEFDDKGVLIKVHANSSTMMNENYLQNRIKADYNKSTTRSAQNDKGEG